MVLVYASIAPGGTRTACTGSAVWRTVCTLVCMTRPFAVAALFAAATACSAAAQQPQPLKLVDKVDLSRYAGTWFEVARTPNEFQNDCAGDVTATYTPQPDGDITVVNKCRKADGTWNEAEGAARRADDKTNNAALEVRFAPAILSFLPNVWGDYRIIGLDRDYRWAVVGEPKREYLWILSRTPKMSAADYDRAVSIAKANGFDVSKLNKTAQSR
jgi:apolipoprotein D and lipocalin family protein